MAVVLRLKRLGRRNRPFYRICVMDRHTRRDGRAIEELGHYDPINPEKGKHFVLNVERAKHWLSVGAQPSDTVTTFLKESGIDIAAVRKGDMGSTEVPTEPVAAAEPAAETVAEPTVDSGAEEAPAES
ncbi:MAG: 30S ribosomal protein S16 [Planctomycetota bacterium]|jgi:small subunit ribosomal protein S16